MKKIFFVAVLAITAGFANSQDNKNYSNPFINKGDWMIGGTESWYTSQYKGNTNSKANTFSLSPDYGYLFTNKLAGGLRLNYTSYSQPNVTNSSTFTNFQVAPYLRYYFLPEGSKTNILGDVSYGFGSEGGSKKLSYNYFGVMAGPEFFLNQNTGLQVLGTYKTWGGDAYTHRENEFGLWAGFQNHYRCHNQPSWSPVMGKGDWLAGGDLWLSFSKESGISNSNTTYFATTPDLGYFFCDHFVGGLRLNYNSTKVQSSSDAFVNFYAEPFARYYFLPKADKTNIFGDFGYAFGSTGQTTKKSYNFWQISAGPSFFLSPNTSLDAGLIYQSYGGDAYSTHYNSWGIGATYQVHLGDNGGYGKK